jgi:hypothetical protein
MDEANLGLTPYSALQMDPWTGKPVAPALPGATPAPAVAGVGGAGGGQVSGQPSEQDKMMMDYMLKMGPMSQQEKDMQRKSAMGDLLRGDAGDAGGMVSMNGRQYFSPTKGVGDVVNKMAGGYLKGKADRDTTKIGGEKSNLMKSLAGKFGFGGGSAMDGIQSFPTGGGIEGF